MRVLLGMSGGVDSSYAAVRLREMGYTVEGAIIKMHEYTECDAAVSVAKSLDIPLHIIDGRELFSSVVKSNFVEEYSRGRTPNPCIICNERVKFRLLYDYAVAHGFDKIATGHYAEIAEIRVGDTIRHAVRKTDSKKDQSYMLYRLPEEILDSLVLPLSDMSKDEVRSLSREALLPVAEKEESMEICFLPGGKHYEYVESAVGERKIGNFITSDGRILGQHEGICRYTVGQRKGLGISLGERAFVTDINPETAEVTLSSEYSGKPYAILSDPVFSGISREEIQSAETDADYPFEARVRYTAPLVKCRLEALPDGTVLVRFATPQRIAMGQSAVVYRDEIVMLGGIIEN